MTPCPQCHGFGRYADSKCPRCRGSGVHPVMVRQRYGHVPGIAEQIDKHGRIVFLPRGVSLETAQAVIDSTEGGQ